MADVSVIIAVRNGKPHLRDQLQALTAEKLDRTWELLVVDNGSLDGTASLVESFRGQLPLHVLSEPEQGKARALNRGMKEASGRMLLFLDHDDVIQPGYLQFMVSALDREPVVGARMDTRILNPWWTWGEPTGQEDAVPDGCHLSGSCLGVRSEVVQQVGEFSAEVGVWEDYDFTWRIHRSGFPLSFVPNAVLAYRLRGDE